MTGVQTCALPICFPVTISRAFGLLKRKEREISTARKIYEDTTSTVESSLFTYTLNDVDYIAKIKDDTQGNLMVVSTVNGVIQLLKDKVGTVDYTTGEITISELVYDDVGQELQVYGITKKLDLETKANKILQIESKYLVVSALGIRE